VNAISPGLHRELGRYEEAVAIAPLTWFRVGGPAEAMFTPSSAEALGRFMRGLDPALPVLAIGAGSNLIVRDGGVPGVVVRLGKSLGSIEVDDDALLVGGGAADALVARRAAEAGITGLEFLVGIPGTIGGAIAMNAGAYGGEIGQVLDWAEIVTRGGDFVRLPAEALAFRYRASALPPESVVVRARLKGMRGGRARAEARMAEIRARREATQPVRERTGGSTFRNPDPGVSSLKAWELVDQAGCRGLALGGAQVSPLHTNFLVNTGSATAADIEGLGELVRATVLAQFGIELAWEIKRLGLPGRPG
jgi:UDP-N-acetylmuramate dehydrogenase